MHGRVFTGVVAGAVGTLVLDAVTYGDVTLRGRPPSEVPAETVERIARRWGIDLAPGDDDRRRARATGLGALGGDAVGVGGAVAYALVAGALRSIPAPARAVLVAAAVMAAGNAGAVSTGTTDPRSWGVSGWLADAVPHVAYGAAVVAVEAALRTPR